jgi:uncharacterized protein (TIGR02271 family)
MSFEPTTAGIPSAKRRTVTAFFDNREDAQSAVDALRAEGVASADIDMISASERAGAAGEAVDRPYEEEGFWASLANLFMPSEDRYHYAEGLRRGGYLVTVYVRDEAQYEAVADILDDDGTIDIDERSRDWRSEGWQPGAASSATSTGLAATRDLPDNAMSRGMVDEPSGALASGAAAGRATGETVIPVAREELKVGKRAVDAGRVRIRSYVVEEPVEQDVQLRDEHVHVERRAVDRPVSGGADPFRERTIELDERGEEAVVSKNARIVEEVALGKDEAYRTEKVRDTVRRTEVEVEDERRSATSGSEATEATPVRPGKAGTAS